jgi:uncharacterized sulfatase
MANNTISRRRVLSSAVAALPAIPCRGANNRPNILFAIADDFSWAHTTATGDKVVRTPAVDEVAQRGVLFTNAVCGSPGCAPSRASVLTGRPHWQLEEAGTHASYFPKKFQVYPELLAAAGYHVGVTGKGAGPCNWKDAGWEHNPAGPDYSSIQTAEAPKGVSRTDYAANFEAFLKKKRAKQPFCFWYGGTEPHRAYAEGAGARSGKRIQDVVVPPFLPDAEEVRNDILDYYFEIEHFDRHLGRIVRALERAGELSNTLIVVTADNGMPFPGAKATMFEYGIHAPLAVCWPDRVPGGRTISDLVSFADFAPTFLQAAGVRIPGAIAGKSLLPVLEQSKSGQVDTGRTFAISGRERHSHARFDNLGYPARALRTSQFLYIRNFEPDRWPAGDPEFYYDIDASPTKSFMLKHRDDPSVREKFAVCFGKNPAEQLFDIKADPGCTRNLAGSAAQESVRKQLRAQLERELTRLQDPRMHGRGDVWESYPRFSAMRPALGGFAEEGKYNPKYKR